MPTTQLLPYVWAVVATSTSAQVIPSNPSRKGLIFFNNSVNTIFICPAFQSNGQPLAASAGAGSISIVPGGLLSLPQPGMETLGAVCNSAFNAFATVGSAFTIWEF